MDKCHLNHKYLVLLFQSLHKHLQDDVKTQSALTYVNIVLVTQHKRTQNLSMILQI